MRRGTPLILTLLAALASAEAPPEPQRGRLSGYVIPVAGADTDDGAGGGVRAEVASLVPGLDPYRWAAVVHLYATPRFHHHRLRLDLVDLGPTRLRLSTNVAFRWWQNDTYAGIGPSTVRERAFIEDVGADDPRRTRYRYGLLQPFLHVTARQPLCGDSPWQVFVALNPKWSRIDAPAGSVLAEEQPFGMEGGFTAQAIAGILYDSRSPEVAPSRGWLLELSGRGAPDLGGEAGGFAGVLVSARGYTSTGERLVWAGRLMGEILGGTVPFWEMAHWGGAIPVSSGAELTRGLRYGRFRGPAKAVANGELRWRAVDLRIGRSEVGLELAPFVDAITVSGPRSSAPDGAWVVHPGAGWGNRVVFDRTFVGRLDVAWGLDPVLEPSGAVTQEPTLGFYLAFDHPF